jgi:Nickel responsive protein SCO4226-like
MKTYLIQRNVPGAGKFTAAERKSLAQRSFEVLEELGPDIQWQHSYITSDNIWCIYKAENIELVREHARRGDFPANYILEVAAMISPATATADLVA